MAEHFPSSMNIDRAMEVVAQSIPAADYFARQAEILVQGLGPTEKAVGQEFLDAIHAFVAALKDQEISSESYWEGVPPGALRAAIAGAVALPGELPREAKEAQRREQAEKRKERQAQAGLNPD